VKVSESFQPSILIFIKCSFFGVRNGDIGISRSLDNQAAKKVISNENQCIMRLWDADSKKQAQKADEPQFLERH
jgi:hypothetical protein